MRNFIKKNLNQLPKQTNIHNNIIYKITHLLSQKNPKLLNILEGNKICILLILSI